mgnify:FL=1|jgi:hypothetical protein|tara:strand:- start:2219 stop:2542 length:324 start_codon:yes stop_codon:yes gene_type:complete
MVKERRAVPPDFDRHDSLVEELWRIAEIGRVISSTLNPAEVYPSSAEHTRALISFDRMIIATFSENESAMVEQYVGGIRINDPTEEPRTPVVRDDQYRRVFVEKTIS